MSFAKWLESASSWAAGVIAEYETGQADAAPFQPLTQPPQGGDADECQDCQSE